MKVLIDATVMQQPATGVAKTVLGLYQGCLKLLPSMQVELLHRLPLTIALPEKMQSVRWGARIPHRFWRSLMIPIAVSIRQPTLVHFPWNGDVPRPLPGCRVVTTLHDVLPLEIPNYFPSDEAKDRYRAAKQRDIDRSDLVLTVSEYSKEQIVASFRVRKEPIVIYHGCSLKAGKLPGGSTGSDAGDYFLYVGGYDPRKGLTPLLEVFITLRRQGKLYSKLILTGNKHYFSEFFKQLVEEGSQLGIVQEMDYVPDDQLASLLANARALVYPSKYEGFGLPVLEAMTLGCPVITTRHTSIPEVCGEAAYYIEPDDKQGFAQALIALESNSELRRALQSEGRRQAAKFSWDKAASKYLEALAQLPVRRGFTHKWHEQTDHPL